MKVILASSNNGKIKEFKEILARFNIEVLSLKDINFTQEIIEDGNSFYENALIKAESLWEIVQKPVIADDSGICVDALDGKPGIYSARYCGRKFANSNATEDGHNLSQTEQNSLLIEDVKKYKLIINNTWGKETS